MLDGSALQHGGAELRLGRTVRTALPIDRASNRSANLVGTSMSLPRNALIYGENDPADHLYKVVRGAVRTCKVLIDGRRQVDAFYFSGDTFGLETGYRHGFSAEAVADVKMLAMKRKDLACPAEWGREGADDLWALMAQELKRAQDHALLLCKNAQERVAGFLLDMAERAHSGPEVDLPMSRQDIADYLGLTIETVSRVLTQFENRSAIALTTSRRIALRSPTALKRMSV